eukprot:scaffold37126_cov19-Tisochrysis_lutea.AAC.3
MRAALLGKQQPGLSKGCSGLSFLNATRSAGGFGFLGGIYSSLQPAWRTASFKWQQRTHPCFNLTPKHSSSSRPSDACGASSTSATSSLVLHVGAAVLIGRGSGALFHFCQCQVQGLCGCLCQVSVVGGVNGPTNSGSKFRICAYRQKK